MRNLVSFLLLISFSLSTLAQSRELIGIKMPEDVTVQGKKLLLNGMGLRKKDVVLGISVNVYAGGLYLEKPSQDANEIIESPGIKQMRMTFARNVDKDSLKKAWQESFEKNCGTKCEALKPKLTELQGLLKDVEEDKSMIYTFAYDKVELEIKGKPAGIVQDKDFSKIVLSAWIGNPPNPELKEGLLGKADSKK